MSVRKTGPRMYTTAQLTTAKLPNIHDLSVQVSDSTGEWETICDLQNPTVQPFSLSRPVTEEGEDDILLLRYCGRLWISWKDACKVHNTGRQFLNYRILNHCTNLDILRLQPADARALSALTGGGWMPANRDSKLIFFDHVELAKIPLQPFKKRVKPSRSASQSGDDERRQKNRERRHGKHKSSVSSDSVSDFSDDDFDRSYDAASPADMALDLETVSGEGLMAPTSEFGHHYADGSAAAASYDQLSHMSLSPPRPLDAADAAEPMQLRKRTRARRESPRAYSGWAAQLHLDDADDEEETECEPEAGVQRLRGRDFVSHVREQQRRRREFELWCQDILRQFGAPRSADPLLEAVVSAPAAAAAASEAECDDVPSAKRVHMQRDEQAELIALPAALLV